MVKWLRQSTSPLSVNLLLKPSLKAHSSQIHCFRKLRCNKGSNVSDDKLKFTQLVLRKNSIWQAALTQPNYLFWLSETAAEEEQVEPEAPEESR